MSTSPNRRRLRALAGALVVSLALGAPASAARPEPAFQLTILHSNDGESKLLGAGTGPLADYGGVGRFATVVERLRAEGYGATSGRERAAKRGVIMLSSGDNFLAGAQFTASLRKGAPYYDSLAMDRIGYDAIAVGNHDFDFGPDVLADFIAGFGPDARFVSANLDVSGEPRLAELARQGRLAASTVVIERGERIGIVGATTPQLPNISSPRDAVALADVAGAIQREVDRLRHRAVDKIVLISHLQNIAEDRALAASLRGVDVMIAGGGDELLANPGDLLVPGDTRSPSLPYPMYAQDADGTSVPVITTAGDYKYVGRLTVTFDRAGNVVGIDQARSGPVRVSGTGADAVPSDPALQTAVVEPVAAFVAGLAANVVATTEVPLEGRRGSFTGGIVTPGVRTAETNLGNLTADSMLWAARRQAAAYGVDAPQVALQNGGGIRNNSLIPAGNLTELDTFNILAFANFVSVKEDIPAATFKEILETSVSEINNGRFGQWAGVRFTWSPGAQKRVIDATTCAVTIPGSRVQDVWVGGTQVFDEGVFVGPAGWTVDLATNDFTFRGGDCYAFGPGGFTTVGTTYQQALYDYLSSPAAAGGLEGVVRAASYPAGGEGRILPL